MRLKMRATLDLSALLLGVVGCGQQAAPAVTAMPTGVKQTVTGSGEDPGY
jgi:hypothetical protein